jgi:hypothetical protein
LVKFKLGERHLISGSRPTTRGELQQGFVGTEEWAQEAELAVHLAMAFLRRLPAGEAGVVGNAIEELGVEFLEEGGAIFADTYEQAGGEFFSNLAMMAEVFGGAGHGRR